MAQGNSDLSFNLLNNAESLMPLEDRGILLQHRGLILVMVGRMDEARGGQAVVRTGDEIVGFAAALLYSGCKTVVSSVARVDDHPAASAIVTYHRALTQGYTRP
jgi:hypothetical protein